MKNIKQKILVVGILVALFLQLGNRINEPYPAILLPGGGGLIWNTNNISIYEYQLVVYDSEGLRKVIEPNELLDSMPEPYVRRNIPNLFKLAKKPNRKDSLKIAEGRDWLRLQLQKIAGSNKINRLEIKGFRKNIYLKNARVDSINKTLFLDSFNIFLN